MSPPVIFEEKLVSETVTEFVVSIRTKINQLRRIILLSFLFIPLTILVYYGILQIYLVVALLITLGLLTSLCNSSCVTEESILIVRDFGIQLRQKYYNRKEVTKFIDKSRVNRIFIHEYITGSTVKFCLAFSVRDEPRLSLMFRDVTPLLPDIQRVYLACVDSILGADGDSGSNRYQ